MEVHVKPEVQARLEQMSLESGRSSDELVEDALIGYIDEFAAARQMLDRRYDDLENGKVQLVSGDEMRARLRAKSAARLARFS